MENRPQGLARLHEAVAGVAEKPKGGAGGGCDLEGCEGNSLDADCKKISCLADDAGCSGNYGSGRCHDLKELHDAALCELAKGGCGDTLPRDPKPACGNRWDFRCRLTPLRPSRVADRLAR
jgi:hypothetical protein